MTVRTVTLSPGFDHDVVVDRLEPGAVGSLLHWRTYAAGKGLNVSRTLGELGVPSIAYALAGEYDRDRFVATARADGVEVVTACVPGTIRNNLTLRVGSVASRSGHAAGPRLANVPQSAVTELFARIAADVVPGDIVTLSGSLPTGYPASAWTELAAHVVARSARVIADAQGGALIALLETGLVYSAKPNIDEATALVPGAASLEGRGLADAALARMRGLGVADPVVTAGADGVYFTRDGELRRAVLAVAAARIEVGAGDAFIAGYCSALDGTVFDGWEPVLAGLAVASAHVEGLEGVALVERALSARDRILVKGDVTTH